MSSSRARTSESRAASSGVNAFPEGSPGIVDLEPQFVDAVDGDFHLLPTSPGVDFAPEIDGIDLDGNPRTVDLANIGNVFGPADVGAYEIQAQGVTDLILQNGFDP
jgi:hypothetical protein